MMMDDATVEEDALSSSADKGHARIKEEHNVALERPQQMEYTELQKETSDMSANSEYVARGVPGSEVEVETLSDYTISTKKENSSRKVSISTYHSVSDITIETQMQHIESGHYNVDTEYLEKVNLENEEQSNLDKKKIPENDKHVLDDIDPGDSPLEQRQDINDVILDECHDEATRNEVTPTSVNTEANSTKNSEYESVTPLIKLSRRQHIEDALKTMRNDEVSERAKSKTVREQCVNDERTKLEALRKPSLSILTDTEKNKKAIKQVLKDEDVLALRNERRRLRQETQAMKKKVDVKYGTTEKSQAPKLLDVAREFCGRILPNAGIPEHMKRELTTGEIEDLKLIYDMFDRKGKGYIDLSDLKRATKMLGFKARRKVYREMIDEFDADQRGGVSFIGFLEIVIQSHEEGPDPYGEIAQAFAMIDEDNKGYMTFDDIRAASESVGLVMSNRTIIEMMQEGDGDGDGSIDLGEFTNILLQTNRFRML